MLEFIGISFCILGLCAAITFVAAVFSPEQLTKDRQQVLAQVDEMKQALVAAKVPEEQIPGLLRVHKAALANTIGCEDFIVLYFLVSLSLWVSSLGLIIALWAKLRVLAAKIPSQPAS